MISNAAIGRIDVLGLVYTAAYVPDTNETIENVSIAEHAFEDLFAEARVAEHTGLVNPLTMWLTVVTFVGYAVISAVAGVGLQNLVEGAVSLAEKEIDAGLAINRTADRLIAAVERATEELVKWFFAYFDFPKLNDETALRTGVAHLKEIVA